MGILISQYKDPVINQPGFNGSLGPSTWSTWQPCTPPPGLATAFCISEVRRSGNVQGFCLGPRGPGNLKHHTLWIQGSTALNARKGYNLGAICIFLGGTWIHRDMWDGDFIQKILNQKYKNIIWGYGDVVFGWNSTRNELFKLLAKGCWGRTFWFVKKNSGIYFWTQLLAVGKLPPWVDPVLTAARIYCDERSSWITTGRLRIWWKIRGFGGKNPEFGHTKLDDAASSTDFHSPVTNIYPPTEIKALWMAY